MSELTFTSVLIRMLAGALPLLIALVLPAVVHVWVAKRCGDSTAADKGLLTINPLKHLNGISLIPFVCTSITSPFVLSWAKPLPNNPQNFRHPLRDTLLVALSSPLTNVLLAFIFTILFALFSTHLPTIQGQKPIITEFTYCEVMLYAGIRINFAIAWFSLLPIPPLAGSAIIGLLLPEKMKISYLKLERYMFPIVPILMITGLLSFLLLPFIDVSMHFAATILML